MQVDHLQVIRQELEEGAKTLQNFLDKEANLKAIQNASEIIATAINNGNKVISCGNGGSHCDAMHFAEELTGRYRDDRRALPAIAISDPSHISCVSNDYGYEHIFSRYVEGLGRAGDVLVAISTSGNSPNIVNAVAAAKARGMQTIALTGKNGGKLRNAVDLEICVEHFGYADRIQEIHIKIIHILILLIEKQV